VALSAYAVSFTGKNIFHMLHPLRVLMT